MIERARRAARRVLLLHWTRLSAAFFFAGAIAPSLLLTWACGVIAAALLGFGLGAHVVARAVSEELRDLQRENRALLHINRRIVARARRRRRLR